MAVVYAAAFLVAGIATWYALQKKGAGSYLKERVFRLLIPLVLGILLIVPIQGYMARLQQGTLSGGYFNYLFTQFFPDFSDISGYHGTFTPAHTVVHPVSFRHLLCTAAAVHPYHPRAPKKGTGIVGQLFGKGWFLLLLFIPLTMSEALPDIGGKNPFFYGLYYTIGFLIASNEGAFKAIDKSKWWSLGVMAVSIPCYLLLRGVAEGCDKFAWQSILLAHVRNLYGFSALLTMMAFAQKYLNRGGRGAGLFEPGGLSGVYTASVGHDGGCVLCAAVPGDLSLQYILIVLLTPDCQYCALRGVPARRPLADRAGH